MSDDLDRDVQALLPDLVAWRRDFHRHPELAFEERRTSGVIRAFLEECGIEVAACAGTGLRGVLRGGAPGGGLEGGASRGRTVALRADMDALPISEENEVDYRSEAPGVMHACGHDGHMAILMGAARLLSARRASLPGTVVFLCQPSEERHPGGARPMIEAGALEGVDAIFGLHLWQPLPAGVVGLRSGPIMAASDAMRLVVTGRGGHASQPHLAIDPVLAAAHVVVAAQSVVSRSVDPLESAVVSFTSVQGGRTHNIIPDRVTLLGTVRTLDAGVREAVKGRLREVVERTCAAFGASATLEFDEGYPPVVNAPEVTERVARAARAAFRDDRVRPVPPVMGGEDFAYYLQRVPGAFALLGIGRPGSFPHHHARFDLDERVLGDGVRLMAGAALELLRA